jgi:lipoprotein-anchoring transpeptidase ErfK/SrfK
VASLVTVLLVLVGAACSGGGEASLSTTSTVATTTTTAIDPTEVTVATAKGTELAVLATPPAGVDVPTSPPTTLTAPPARQLPPIPRVGLNSAGSRKTPDGWSFDTTTFFDNPLVMPVIAESGDWLQVMVPARPNGSTGWIRAADVDLSTHHYRMELDLSAFHLTVYDGSEVIAETDVVIGKDATYTPVGRFYLNEVVPQSNPGGVYGPFVLSTNGYSESLETFDGGLPVIAFHGTNQPQLIGTKASNGCVRMPNDVITFLADTLPAGTPIDILAGAAPGTAAA